MEPLDYIKDLISKASQAFIASSRAVKRKIGLEPIPATKIIDLKDKRMARFSGNTDPDSIDGILVSDFVEWNNPNNIRKVKDFRNTRDSLIGDQNIPLKEISQYWGVEDGKLKVGDLNTFRDNTTVVPKRNKNIGLVNKVRLYTPNRDSIKIYNRMYKDAFKRDLKRQEDYYTQYFDSLGIEYPSKYNPFRIWIEGLDELDSIQIKEFWRGFPSLEESSKIDKLRNPRIQFVTDNGPVEATNNIGKNKMFFSNENGDAIFVNNLQDINQEQLDSLNKRLRANPAYPVLVDNGRYSHYYEKNGDYKKYISGDFHRPDETLFVIGTKKHAD